MADDFEGSTSIEGFDEDFDEGETSEDINNQDSDTSDSTEGEGDDTDTKADADTNDTQDTDDDGQKLTDKGTKLDPDPKSAYHQQLANAKREVEEYRRFMTDPKALKNYISDLEKELGEATGQTKQEIRDKAEDENYVTDPDKIETADDLRSYAKFLKKDLEKTKDELRQEAQTRKVEEQDKAIGDQVVSEVSQVQAKYSVLREFNPDGTKNPEFDAELEKEIADEFKDVDFNPKTGKFMGKHSLMRIADRFMKIHNRGKSSGTKDAQTIVADKRHGAIRSGGGKSQSLDESKMSAAQLIASRMARARR